MAQALGLVVPIFGPRLDSRVLAADVAMVRLMLEVRYRELESRVEQALASQTANALSSATENFGARRAHLQGEWETGVVTPQRVEAVVAQSQHAISAAVLHLAADCTKDLLAAAAWAIIGWTLGTSAAESVIGTHSQACHCNCADLNEITGALQQLCGIRDLALLQ